MNKANDMSRSYIESAKAYHDAREAYQGAITKRTSLLTEKLFETQTPEIIEKYSQLLQYFENNLSWGQLPSALEKILGQISPPKKERSANPRKKYLTFSEAIELIKQKEISNGLSDSQLANEQAYRQKIRYQIKKGNLIATKREGQFKKIDRCDFDKMLPFLAYSSESK